MVGISVMVLALAGNLYGQIMLSEVLSNEPGGRVRLEWIEIFNRSDSPVDLGGYIVNANGSKNNLPSGIFIDSHSYAILARQLLPEDGSDSFEGYWGDSSGFWDDSDIEGYLAIDIAMIPNNQSGFVTLTDTAGNQLDYVSWASASDESRSIERDDLYNDASGWHDCFDPDGSTPGRANSPVPEAGKEALIISVEPVLITPDGDGVNDWFMIDIVIPPGTKITVEVYDETGLKRNTLLSDSDVAVLSLVWDGMDDKNEPLTPGVYIIGFFLSGQRNDTKFIPVVIAP